LWLLQASGPTLGDALLSRYRSPTTPEQLLSEALYLIFVAPGDDERRGAQLLVERIVEQYGVDEHVIELARAHALERAEAHRSPKG
jgi:hypothetical protein